MLSTRFRNIRRYLGDALNALSVSGRAASGAVLEIVARVAMRCGRLEALMDRFEAGTLRSRAFAPRRSGGQAPRKASVPVERGWPEHRPFWLFLVGHNHPSPDVRMRWDIGNGWGAYGPPEWRGLLDFAQGLRALVTTDEVMRGLLGVSRAARREARWCLRMTGKEAMPEILREPPRRRTPRTVPQAPRKPRERWAPRPKRPPGPFELPPENLSRDEKVRRGLPVPAPIVVDERDRVGFWSAEQQGRRTPYRQGRG